MPLLPYAVVLHRLRCPRCKKNLTDGAKRCSNSNCELSRDVFSDIAGVPVLIDPDDSIVDVSTIEAASQAPLSLARRVLGRLAARNAVASRVSARLSEEVSSAAVGDRPVVLVIGGGTVGSGLEELYDDPKLDVISFDVYPSRFTQFVADAHLIPLADGSVDGVVIQAVLEHVLDPGRVVAEIHRVLKPNGLVYADTPFLQHVHEGPFDFTRFTEWPPLVVSTLLTCRVGPGSRRRYRTRVVSRSGPQERCSDPRHLECDTPRHDARRVRRRQIRRSWALRGRSIERLLLRTTS